MSSSIPPSKIYQLVIGTNVCPLPSPLLSMEGYATPSWVRSFWQGLSHYNFWLKLDYPNIPMPWEEDALLLILSLKRLRGDGTYPCLKQWHCKWGLLFLSDMVSSDGRRIERGFLEASRMGTLSFPEERPTMMD